MHTYSTLGVMDPNDLGRRLQRDPETSLRDLYPGLSDAKLAEAEAHLTNYFRIVQTICQRLENEPIGHFDTPETPS